MVLNALSVKDRQNNPITLRGVSLLEFPPC